MLKWFIYFISFFLISPVWADDNPRLISYPSQKIMGFRGLDTETPAPNIDDGRAIDLLNVQLSSSFNLVKRPGQSLITGRLDDLDMDSPAITGLFDSEYSNGSSYTFGFVGHKLKYDTGTTWQTVSGSGVITDGANNQFVCLMALDNAICTNNIDRPLKIDNIPSRSMVGFAGLTDTITTAKATAWFRNYLIFGNTNEGGTARPTRFRWGNVGTINTFSNEDFVDIASLSGDEIVAFREMYGDLYIFMRKSIWKASLVGGNDVFVFIKIIDGIGAIAKNSVQTVNLPNDRLGIIFISEEKRIYLFNGIFITDIGSLIQTTLDNLLETRLEYAVAVFDGDNYFISLTTDTATTNDIVLVYNVFINEWFKYDQINSNAFARIKDSSGIVKTYSGNYDSFIYWMDDPDNNNDVDGAIGVLDSIGTFSTNFGTDLQALIDSGLSVGVYTGAIVRITSGTGAGQEKIIISGLTTGVIVESAFSTTPDSTSNYSIGDINSFHKSKWYDFGDATRVKTFREIYYWGKEEDNGEVVVSFAKDFGGVLDNETKNLTPPSSSLWDVALWDVATWGSLGDNFYTTKLKGNGRFVQIQFSQDEIDKTFNIYGFNLLAERQDVQ